MKICKQCNINKEENEFYKRNGICKKCYNKNVVNKRKEAKVKASEKGGAWSQMKSWKIQPATKKQLDFIQKYYSLEGYILTRGKAFDIIEEIINEEHNKKATDKQKKYLIILGFQGDIDLLTKNEARNIIDELIQNNKNIIGENDA